MKFYRVCIKIYYNGELIYLNRQGKTLCDNTPVNKIYDIMWDTLDESMKMAHFGFNCYKKKKGRIFEIFSPTGRRYVFKEWKEELNLHGVVLYEEYTPSIQKILDWHEGDKAIQYLVERGINVMKG